MKRYLLSLLLALVASIGVNAAVLPDGEFTVDGIKYETISWYEARLIGYTKVPVKLTVDSLTYKGEKYRIREIGDNVFKNCPTLTEVTIAPCVENMGSGAFADCPNLAKFTVEDSENFLFGKSPLGTSPVKQLYLGRKLYAYGDTQSDFSGSIRLESVAFGPSVTDITRSAFSNCGMTTLTIPATVRSIRTGAFANCPNLDSVTFEDGDASLSGETGIFTDSPIYSTYIGRPSIYGTLFSGHSTLVEATLGPLFTELSAVIFPNCSMLRYVNFPEQITVITDEAFVGCALTTVPPQITTIGKGAFRNGTMRSFEIPATVKEVGEKAFQNCTYLTNLKIANSSDPLELASSFVESPIQTLHLGRDITSRLNLAAGEISKISFGSGITIIPGGLCQNSLIREVTLPANIKTIGLEAFLNCKNLTTVNMSDGLETIGRSAFENCTNLTTTNMPDGVKSIGASAFKNCTNLKLTHLPAALTMIAKDTFSGCTNLSLSGLHDNIQTIESEAFYHAGLPANITIPASVTSIGAKALPSNFDNLTIAASPTHTPLTLGDSAFGSANTLTIERDVKSDVESGVEFSGNNLIFGQSMSKLPQGTFDFKSIDIQAPVKTIGQNAFYGLTRLVDVTLPEGLEEIEFGAFSNCTKLAKITLPSTLKSLGAAFKYTAITTIVIPHSVTYIDNGALTDMPSLTSVTFADSPEPIKLDTWIFGSPANKMLDYLYIGRQIDDDIAGYDFGTKIMEFGPYVSVIPSSKVLSCMDGVGTLHIPGTVKTIGSDAFFDQTIGTLIIDEGVQQIGNWAFYKAKLPSIQLPASLTYIGDNAFGTGYTDVYCPAPEPPSTGSWKNASNATLHVPAGTKERYASSLNWGEFKNIVDDLPAKALPGISYPRKVVAVTKGDQYTLPQLRNPNNLKITYSSLDPSVATVDANTGEVTFTGPGYTCIIAQAEATDSYHAGIATYTLHYALKDPQLQFSPTYIVGYPIGNFTAPVLSKATPAEATYSSSDWQVASVDPRTGAVTPLTLGTAVITATTPATEYYAGGEASYTLDVRRAPQQMSFSEQKVEASLMDPQFTPPVLTMSVPQAEAKYSSSNPEVATVDAKTGAVTLLTTGTTVITVYASGSDLYTSGEASYTLTVVEKLVSGLKFSATEVSVTIGGNYTLPTFSKKTDAPVTFSSSKPEVATVDAATGAVTPLSLGWTLITASVEATDIYEAGEASYILYVAKGEPQLAFDVTEIRIYEGDDFVPPTLSNPLNVEVTYSSNDESVASVDPETGVVTIHSHGSARITAATPDTNAHYSSSTSYIIYITGSFRALIDGVYYDITPKNHSASVYTGESKEMTSVVIPASVEYDGRSFDVTGISNYAFSEYPLLESAIIAGGSQEMGSSILYRCPNLKYVELPDGLESLTQYMLYGCTSLKTVKFGSGLKYITESSLADCGFEELTIPEGVTKIDTYACLYNSQLITLELPSTLNRISSGSFESCGNLTTIIVKALTPPNAGNVFNDPQVYANATLVVPDGTADLYRTANEWSKFQKIRESSGIESVGADAAPTFPADIYTTGGTLVRSQATEEELHSLIPGIYIVRSAAGTTKIVIR